MSEAKFTPRPLVQLGRVASVQLGGVIAIGPERGLPTAYVVDPHDAALYAAAPDLLHVLQRIVANPEARIGGHIRCEAIAAIAKATAPREHTQVEEQRA